MKNKYAIKSGQKFGSWTTVRLERNASSGALEWLCRCECGIEKYKRSRFLYINKNKNLACRRCSFLNGRRHSISIGQKFCCLTVVSEEDINTMSGKKRRAYLCECSCGNTNIVYLQELLNGKRTSCLECSRSKKIIHKILPTSKNYENGYNEEFNYTHPLKSTWRKIINRCYNHNDSNYVNYGARGIRVADSWHTFETFAKDIGKKPSKDHSVDRINNDGNYSLDNCRWATRLEQASNKRSNLNIKHNGNTKIMSEWARDLNVGTKILSQYLINGHSFDEAVKHFSKPVKKRFNGRFKERIIEYNGISMNLSGWGKAFGVAGNRVSSALRYHSFENIYNKYVNGIGYNGEDERVTISKLFQDGDFKIMRGSSDKENS